MQATRADDGGHRACPIRDRTPSMPTMGVPWCGRRRRADHRGRRPGPRARGPPSCSSARADVRRPAGRRHPRRTSRCCRRPSSRARRSRTSPSPGHGSRWGCRASSCGSTAPGPSGRSRRWCSSRSSRGAEGCDRLQRLVRTGPLHARPVVPVPPARHGRPPPVRRRPDRALTTLADFQLLFTVRGFGLFEHGADGVWRQRRRFPFGSGRG